MKLRLMLTLAAVALLAACKSHVVDIGTIVVDWTPVPDATTQAPPAVTPMATETPLPTATVPPLPSDSYCAIARQPGGYHLALEQCNYEPDIWARKFEEGFGPEYGWLSPTELRIFGIRPLEATLVADYATDAAWSPDGNYLAYMTQGRVVCIVKSDATGQYCLYQMGEIWDPPQWLDPNTLLLNWQGIWAKVDREFRYVELLELPAVDHQDELLNQNGSKYPVNVAYQGNRVLLEYAWDLPTHRLYVYQGGQQVTMLEKAMEGQWGNGGFYYRSTEDYNLYFYDINTGTSTALLAALVAEYEDLCCGWGRFEVSPDGTAFVTEFDNTLYVIDSTGQIRAQWDNLNVDAFTWWDDETIMYSHDGQLFDQLAIETH